LFRNEFRNVVNTYDPFIGKPFERFGDSFSP